MSKGQLKYGHISQSCAKMYACMSLFMLQGVANISPRLECARYCAHGVLYGCRVARLLTSTDPHVQEEFKSYA